MSNPTWGPDTPLPEGCNVLLEASAGTGKTYQMEGVVLRLVVECNVPIEQILVITFTRAAAAELRGRIRSRLVAVRRALTPAGAQDDAEALIERFRPSVCGLALEDVRERLDRALEHYDRAVISTIHSFTHDTLARFALEAHADLDPRQDASDRVVQRRLFRDARAALGAGIDVAKANLAAEMRLPPPCDEDAFLSGILDDRGSTIQPVVDDTAQPPDDAAGFRAWFLRTCESLRAAELKELPRVRDEVRGFLTWADGPGAEAIGFLPGMPKDLGKWNKGGLNEPTPWTGELLDALRSAETVDGMKVLAAKLKAASGTQMSKQAKPPGREAAEDAIKRLKDLGDALAKAFPPPPNLAPALAQHLRAAWLRTRRENALRSYDTMLVELGSALGDGPDAPVTRALREAYRAVLVDEFQDTDVTQWETLRRVFVDGPEHRFVAVGDPKQSIYRFRGANLHVYFEARQLVQETGALYQLATNFRSDRRIVEVLNLLWHAAENTSRFLTDKLQYEPVAGHVAPSAEAVPEPVQVRWFGFEGGKVANKAMCYQAAVAHAVHYVQRLVAAGVKPRDIAILGLAHHELAQLADRLASAGIPSVRRLDTNLFQTSAAHWLLSWLDALAAPDNEGPTRYLALTPFVGWDAAALVTAVESPESTPGGAAWAELRAQVAAAADQFDRRGLAGTFDRWERDRHVRARVVQLGGERAATDLGQLLTWADAQGRISRLGPANLAEELRARRAADVQIPEEEGLTPEVETDADAVKLVTVFASKGLQYDYVLLPFAWYAQTVEDNHQPLRFSDSQGRPVTDLHKDGSDPRKSALEQVKQETREEGRRLLYVALTRARKQVVAWLGAYGSETKAGQPPKFRESPLAQLLGVEDLPAGTEPPPSLRADLRSQLPWHVEPVLTDEATPPSTEIAPPTPPTLERWLREHRLNAGWVLTSFSGLSPGRTLPVAAEGTGLAEAPGDADEAPEDADESDLTESPPEPLRLLPAAPAETHLREPAFGASFFGGTGTGSWLHGVLQHLDFQHPDRALDGRPVEALLRDEGLRHGVADRAQHALASERLRPWLDTPFGAGLPGVSPELRLRDLQPHQRADELEFYLRLGRGHERGATVDETRVRGALEHALHDPSFRGKAWLQAYLQRQNSGGEPASMVGKLRGFLQGFIDAVFQVGEGDSARFVVCDYKTNDLAGTTALRAHTAAWEPKKAPDGKPIRLRRWHYDQANLETGMDHHHYHLQALLYTVAVHRMLRQRLHTYDYDRHVAGHAYLFVRGMEGESTWRDPAGRTLGVWLDRWPRATVEGLSSALEGAP